MAVSAHVTLPIPGTPVPFTLQPLVLFASAAVLGGAAAASAMVAYLAMGLSGLPVFALGGGAAYFAGPTGGYLVGLVPAALVAGSLAGGRRSVWALAFAFAAGIGIVYVCGTAHLAFFLGRPVEETLRASVLPFVPGDLSKIALASLAIAAIRSRSSRRRDAVA
jgi:biotin transport system substrate-specific component